MSKDNIKRGLSCYIFKDEICRQHNVSNSGISQRCTEVILVDIGKNSEIFPVREDRPAVRLVYRDLGGKEPYVHAVPVEQPVGLVGPMFGGSFIHTSDGRFPSSYPIPLHDRWETAEQYEALSR